MSFYEYAAMAAITLIALKYLYDMVRFAMGYEVNGKRRKPMFTLSASAQVSESPRRAEPVRSLGEGFRAAS